MAIEKTKLDLIDDNPYNPRKHYSPAKVKEMAVSLLELGLLQIPKGRKIDGRVQLAYGHMRKRGFASNQKHEPDAGWGMMEVDIVELSDEDMFDYSLEENMRRSDISPIEVARCIDAFSQLYPKTTDKEIGTRHNMTEANVSNMKRVLRLPQKFLEKIDEGIITFTQGRELLTLEGIPGAEEVMTSALVGINTTGNKQYSKPNTVEGLQQSIHSVISGKFPPLDKEWEGYRHNLLFDTREAGCLKCNKCTVTHPTKSKVAHYCTDEECWKKKTDEHKAKAAVVAKAKMEAEVLERAAKDVARRTPELATDISQEKPGPAAAAYKMKKRGTSWIAVDNQGVIIAINYEKNVAEAEAVKSFQPVSTKVNPATCEFMLNHTYRVMTKPGVAAPFSDVLAQNLATAVKALGLKPEDVELAKVHKSSGKIGTGGDVSAGWSKCTESLSDITMEAMLQDTEEHIEQVEKQWEEEEASAAAERESEMPTEVPTKMQPIPDEVLQQAKAAAGTRAEVLDLNDICAGSQYSRQMKQGYALLSDELRHVDEPEECLERCTHGFHYAFDSKYPGEKEIFVCSDLKCLAKKKGDLTRKKNAAGQALKNAEKLAIKQVLDQVDLVTRKLSDDLAVAIPRPVLELIIYNQLHGKQLATYYYGEKAKEPKKWLWDKLSAGTPQEKRSDGDLWKLIGKLSDADLVKLIVEYMFFYLQDHGDTASYEIKTVKPLGFFGVTVDGMKEKEPAAAGVA